MNTDAINRKRYAYLFSAALSFLILGLVYAWSLFATPLAQVYGWKLSDVNVTFTICMMSFCVGGLLGVRILNRVGLRLAILLAAGLLICGFAGTALLAQTGIWALYLFYGVVIGCGTGYGYNVVIATVTMWFPDKTGFASGVLFMGFGLGSITLGNLTRGIIDAAGVPVALGVVAIVAGTVFCFLALFLKRAPEKIGDLLGVQRKTKTAKNTVAKNHKLLKDPAFYTYYLWATIVLGAGLVMIKSSMQGALELGVDATLAAVIVGIVPIVNGASGLSMGVIFDKKGQQFSMTLVAVIAFGSSALLACAFAFNLSALYVLGCLTLVMAYGSVAPLAAGFARVRYDERDYPRYLAVVNTDIAGGSLFQQAVVTSCAGVSLAIYLAMTFFGAVAFAASLVAARLMKK